MRYYALFIDGKEVCSQNQDNPTGLNIQFNVQTYNEGKNANTEITIYNPPLYMFGQYFSLYNKKIMIYGGVEVSPLTKMIGITPAAQNLIAAGYISAVLPQWNNADMQMTFVVTQSPVHATNSDGSVDTTKPPGGYQFRLKGQEDALISIQAAMQAIAPDVPVSSLEAGLTVPAPCNSIVFYPGDVAAIVSTWGYVLQCNAEGYSLRSTDAWLQYSRTIELKRQDFLCQPNPLGVSTMAITSFLRGDIRLGDIVVMPKDIFVGIENLSGVITDSSGVDAFLNEQHKNVFSMFSGSWTVTKIWHVGDLRNTDPQSWATHFEVARV